MQGHPEDFTHNVLYKITQDSISPGCPQDIFTGTCTRSCNDLLDDFSRITRSSQKDLYMGGFSARSSHMELCRSCKDLSERSPPGSPQESHKTCTRSCKDLSGRTLPGSPQELLTRACTRSHFISRAFCASLRSRNALGHLRRCMFCENLQEKCRAPEISRTFCWSLRRRKSFGHLRITILLRISRKVPRPRSLPQVFCELAQ